MADNAQIASEIAGGDVFGIGTLATPHEVCQSTVLRWILKGLPSATGGRVRLEAVRRGRRWVTSSAAVGRFFAALPTTPSEDVVATCKAGRQLQNARQLAAEDAKRQLRDRFGI